MLSIGDKGARVKEIKMNLALLGYLPSRDNDIFQLNNFWGGNSYENRCDFRYSL